LPRDLVGVDQNWYRQQPIALETGRYEGEVQDPPSSKQAPWPQKLAHLSLPLRTTLRDFKDLGNGNYFVGFRKFSFTKVLSKYTNCKAFLLLVKRGKIIPAQSTYPVPMLCRLEVLYFVYTYLTVTLLLNLLPRSQ
jgi:hypothetical protein